MPKDNEVDEKVMPVAWIVTNGGESCEPWLEYEQSEVDALPAMCIAEPLYSAATVAELRAEVERLREANQIYSFAMNTAGIDELKRRADAAERRVAKLAGLLSDTAGNLRRMANDELAECDQVRLEHVVNRIEDHLTGADPT